MSFILDALRKSESERHRLELTSLAELRMRRRRTRPWWAIALAILLIANLGLLAAVMLRPKASPVTAVVENAKPAASAPNNSLSGAKSANAPPRNLTLAQLADAEPQVTYEAVDRSVLDAAGAPPATPPLVRPLRDAGATQASVPATQDQPVDSMADLHLDMHVYSPTAANRFVFINKRKYSEGQTLAEGPRVEQITADGVTLSHQGSRWSLRRP